MVGKGTDMAAMLNPEMEGVMDDLKDQLIIVLVKRLGNRVDIPVAEMDDTSMDLLSLRISEDKVFTFIASKKE